MAKGKNPSLVEIYVSITELKRDMEWVKDKIDSVDNKVNSICEKLGSHEKKIAKLDIRTRFLSWLILFTMLIALGATLGTFMQVPPLP